MGDAVFHGQESAGQVGVDRRVPLVERHLLDRTLHAIDAGVRKDHVEPTKRLYGTRDRAADLLLRTNVGNGRQRAAALGLNLLGHRPRRLVTHIDDGHRCPGLGQRVAGTLANARPATSDERDLFCERCIHTVVHLAR
jgi:hypothetical protein